MLLDLKELFPPDQRTIIEPHSSSLQFLTIWDLIVISLGIVAGRSLRRLSTPGHQGFPSLPGGMALSNRKSATSFFNLELNFPLQGKNAI